MINGLVALEAVTDVKRAIPDQNSTLTSETRRFSLNKPALLSDRPGAEVPKPAQYHTAPSWSKTRTNKEINKQTQL